MILPLGLLVGCGGTEQSTDEIDQVASVSEALFESACPTLAPNATFTWDIGAPGVLVNPPYGTTQCTNAYRVRWGLPLTDDVFVAEYAGPGLYQSDCESAFVQMSVWRENGNGTYTNVFTGTDYGDWVFQNGYWQCIKPKLESRALDTAYAHRIMIGSDVYWTRGPDSVRYWTTD